MAIDQIPYDPADDEHIVMEISSSPFCYSIISPPQPDPEFEFQISYSPISPADELFYNGKILPLHLPPPLQMLLHNTNSSPHEPTLKTQSFEESSTSSTSTANNTTPPFESCNVSPSDYSCQVSRDQLNPDDNIAGFIDHQKKSWSKKLKYSIKQSSLGVKLKASRAYLKSLLIKSGRSDETCSAAAARNGDEHTVSKEKECLNKHTRGAKKNPLENFLKERCQVEATVTRVIVAEKGAKDGSDHRRWSLSAQAIKWYTRAKWSSSSSSSSSSYSSSSNKNSSSSSSSSSSVNSNKHYGLQQLKSSSSANSEAERLIQEAINHCKQSQQRKSVNEVGFCSMSASRISACDKQAVQGMCLG